MTETTTVPNKEEPTNINIELDKKTEEEKAEVKAEAKPEEVISVQPEGEVTDAKTEEGPINAGPLYKRNTKGIIKRWSKAYFAFGSEDETPLNNFSTYYKKNKKSLSPNVAANATTTPLTTLAENEIPKAEGTATTETSKVVEPVVSTSSDVIEEVKDAKDVEDKKPEIEEDKEKKPATEETKDNEPEIEEVKDAKDKNLEIEEVKDKDDKKPEIEDKDKKEDKKQELKINNIYDNIAHAHVTGKGLLFYYRSENDINKQPPIGIINLKEYQDIELLNEQSGRQFAFKVVTSYRDFELATDSSSDRDRWVKSIKEKAEEAKTVDVKSSEKYKDAYEKLEQGTAFRSGEHLPSDDVFSGDENLDKQKTPETTKRKSIFPFFGRKPSTTETTTTVTTTETTEDGTRKVITTTTTTETTLGETEETKTEGSSPKSPHRASIFPFSLPFGKKEKEETATSSEEKEDKKDKEKSPEGTTNAETSTAANDTEAPEESKEEKHEEKHKKGLFESFFRKSPKEETTENKESKAEEQTEQTKTDSAEAPADETTQQKDQKEHKEHGLFKNIFKQKQKDETPPETKEGETNEKSTEPSAEAATPEINGEEKSGAKTEEKPGETSTDSKPTNIFGKIFSSKGKHTSENEPSEDKGESKPDDKIEEPKEGKESEEGKKDKQKKEKKKKEEQEKKGPDALSDSSSSSDSSSGTEDRNESSLVRRVTTRINKTLGGLRARSHEKKQDREATANDKPEESEEKKEVVETSDVKSPEKVDSPQIAEQTVPESSAESAETKKKGNFISNFRRKSSGLNKRQDSTQEKGETAEAAAVASASEATDVENADKPVEKEREAENAVQKHTIPEDVIKKGNLNKQNRLTLFDQRHFVLTKEKELYYYRSASDPSTQKSIDLSSDCKVKSIADGGKNFHFELITKTRTFKLYTDSEEDRESWINALKECNVTVVPNEKEESLASGKKTDEGSSTRLEVPKNENDTNLQQVVDNAADKAADAVDASVTEPQETKSTNVETKEVTEEKTVSETTNTNTTTITSS